MNLIVDHLAYRTLNRTKAVEFYCQAIGYREMTQFEIDFEEDGKATCSVLEPNDRVKVDFLLPWETMIGVNGSNQRYVLAPEIFISEGTPGSIVERWAKNRGGAGLHHIAYRVPDNSTVEEEMKKWLDNGWCEDFTSKNPYYCDNMSQIFTKPSNVLGVVFELIKRKEAGFCKDSVMKLMRSTENDI